MSTRSGDKHTSIRIESIYTGEFFGEILVVETSFPASIPNQSIDLLRSRTTINATPVVNCRFDSVHVTSMPNLVFDAIGFEAEKPR